MTDLFETTRVLITVMTYPHPSKKYNELLCTGGITEAGDWVRLYPVDYRYRPRNQQFRKYQWIDVDLSVRKSDYRKESRRPDPDTIRILGPPIKTEEGWRERREIIDRMPHHTLRELENLHDAEKVSLGVVRPTRVLDLEVKPAESDWKPQWKYLFEELRLFDPKPRKPLRKLPYKFTYVFECEDSDKPHRATITDWELGVLWLNEVERLGGEEKAAESVRSKYLDELCRADKDTRFFMGTVLPYNRWMVLGVFWPPKIPQPVRKADQHSLF